MLALRQHALPAQNRGPTLADIVVKLGTDPDGLPTAWVGMRMTSFATLGENGEFAFAGYKDDGTNLLNPPMYVGLRERGRPWRVAAITEPGRHGHFGSATGLSAADSFLIVDMHLTPSAGEMIVLRRDLTYVTRLYGWFETMLPHGLIVFHRSMIHFAPAHPGELATFDPVTGVEAQLYPTNKASPLRKSFVERIRPIYEEWKNREPNHVYGFDPEWFDVSFGELRYDAKTDTLTFPALFTANRHPAEVAPPQTATLTITCRPMRSLRQCTETR